MPAGRSAKVLIDEKGSPNLREVSVRDISHMDTDGGDSASGEKANWQVSGSGTNRVLSFGKVRLNSSSQRGGTRASRRGRRLAARFPRGGGILTPTRNRITNHFLSQRVNGSESNDLE